MKKTNRQVPDEANQSAELGDETGDWSSPRPDANVADEMGDEVGMRLEDEEPLRPIEKIAERRSAPRGAGSGVRS